MLIRCLYDIWLIVHGHVQLLQGDVEEEHVPNVLELQATWEYKATLANANTFGINDGGW